MLGKQPYLIDSQHGMHARDIGFVSRGSIVLQAVTHALSDAYVISGGTVVRLNVDHCSERKKKSDESHSTSGTSQRI